MDMMKSIQLTLFIIALIFTCPLALALGDIPPTSLKVPPMVQEESVSTYLPSESAPGKGLAVNIKYPASARYSDGAPVVVVVPGGNSQDGFDLSIHAPQSGFVEVRFAFPGGGRGGLQSSGIYDGRGGQSQEALRDVLLYAAGKASDAQGKTIADIVPARVYNKTVGVVGWDNGGNILLVTLSKYGQDLSFIGWLAFYESPLGSLFFPPNLGGTGDLIPLRHYRQGSCATGNCLIDFRKLAWQPEGFKSPGAHRRAGEPEVPGVLFFDENGNGRWEESHEFAFSYAADIGLEKQIYPPPVTKALERLHVFGKEWCDSVATLPESEHYYQERDGALYISDVCQKFPSIMVTIFASHLDHMIRQPDHPHIALQYNAWLSSQCKWVRLNPDPVYVAQAAGMNAKSFSDNKANASIDSSSIDAHLEPEGLVPDYVLIGAAIAELSDRVRARNYAPGLAQVLVQYSNGAEPASR